MTVDAVIVAAGSSRRFGLQDKLLADVGGLPLIERTIAAFLACEQIGRIVLVASRHNIETLWQFADDEEGPVRVVLGGERRRDSVEAGMLACSSEFVAIHDGARPFATPDLIGRCIAEARVAGAAIAAFPVTDTIKEVEAGVITGNPDRSRLWSAQTPQVVRRGDWLRAAALDDRDETDDAAMVARVGVKVAVVEGSPSNIKVTHPADVAVARLLVRELGERP